MGMLLLFNPKEDAIFAHLPFFEKYKKLKIQDNESKQ
jgi:hypothetical protein